MKLQVQNQILYVKNKPNSIQIFGFYVQKKDASQLKVKIAEYTYKIKPIIKINIFKKKICFYKIVLPIKDLLTLQEQNEVLIINAKKKELPMPFLLFGKKAFLLHFPFYNLKDLGLAIYLYQTRGNTTKLAVRSINVTDKLTERIKIALAFILSKILFWQEPIVLFEKKAKQYEESASVLFEKLIDQGYNNASFILEKSKIQEYDIKEKYRENVIPKYSFAHYLKIFESELFISTETMFSVFDFYTLNPFFHYKEKYSKSYNYVFLQHGIMYMVALDSPTRKSLQPESWLGKDYRIVVSSELEAEHFIEKGNYPREKLYISGLPKFDTSKIKKNPKNIIIMPTWRWWEENLVKVSPEKSSYYKMIKEMIEGVPKKYKDLIRVLPHPCVKTRYNQTDLKKYIPEKFSHDEELENCRVLITDYSSISYDAFYRGANIIFWWKEKNRCMSEQYKTELMLKEDLIFGDIVYNSEQMQKIFKKSYNEDQSQRYIKNFNKIVQFNDNRNTERVIKFLKEDQFL